MTKFVLKYNTRWSKRFMEKLNANFFWGEQAVVWPVVWRHLVTCWSPWAPSFRSSVLWEAAVLTQGVKRLPLKQETHGDSGFWLSIALCPCRQGVGGMVQQMRVCELALATFSMCVCAFVSLFASQIHVFRSCENVYFGTVLKCKHYLCNAHFFHILWKFLPIGMDFEFWDLHFVRIC